jgi:hypothetical protein
MSKYGDIVYGGATYGATPRLNFSVEPMSTAVLQFDKASITWSPPTGFFTRFRLVRNQNGFPENQEDGLVIYELLSSDGSSLEGSVRTSFSDGEENPTQVKILPGRNIFYSVFLYTVDNEWVRAGQITDVVPDNTGATEKVMNLLPRVFTTPELSPLGVVDPASDLYKFLDGMAFTYEQLQTQIKMIRPSHNTDYANSKTIEAEFLSLGLTEEPTIPTANQRRLIREAIPSYQNKGTLLGVQNYAEALTGFAPVGTVSPNLMLSIQDSTFYNSIGRWVSDSTLTLTATEELLPSIQAKTIDKTWTCKVTATGAGSMKLGMDNYLLQGVPCLSLPYLPYTIGLMVKSPASSGTVTVVMHVYDPDDGTYTTHSSSPLSANNTWQQLHVTSVADADEIGSHSYVGIELIFSAAGTYYVDQISVQPGPVYSYDEARALTLNLLPTRENYINNPSFEVDAAGWTLQSVTFEQSTDIPNEGFPGSYSGKFHATGNWALQASSPIPVEPGSFFCASTYIKSSDITEFEMVLDLYDVNNSYLTTVRNPGVVSPTWTRQYVTALVDTESTAHHAYLTILVGNAGTVYLDMVQGQDTFAPTDYFDGSLPASYGAIWQGTAHNSPTLYYPGKATKIRRLAQTLNEWVPINCWWRITTPAGLEYTVLDV